VGAGRIAFGISEAGNVDVYRDRTARGPQGNRPSSPSHERAERQTYAP